MKFICFIFCCFSDVALYFPVRSFSTLCDSTFLYCLTYQCQQSFLEGQIAQEGLSNLCIRSCATFCIFFDKIALLHRPFAQNSQLSMEACVVWLHEYWVKGITDHYVWCFVNLLVWICTVPGRICCHLPKYFLRLSDYVGYTAS